MIPSDQKKGHAGDHGTAWTTVTQDRRCNMKYEENLVSLNKKAGWIQPTIH